MDAVASLHIDYTQFLDETGRPVRPLPPFAADREEMLAMYRTMVLTRQFDAKAVALQRTGQLGTYASSLGRRLDVDLSMVTPTGPDGMVTATDVQRVHKILSEVGPMQPLRGVRRAMARSLSKAHAEVVAVTISDDSDVEPWAPGRCARPWSP